jgi:hypothetical protein
VTECNARALGCPAASVFRLMRPTVGVQSLPGIFLIRSILNWCPDGRRKGLGSRFGNDSRPLSGSRYETGPVFTAFRNPFRGVDEGGGERCRQGAAQPIFPGEGVCRGGGERRRQAPRNPFRGDSGGIGAIQGLLAVVT